jgi:hypothetical protein
MTTPAWNDELSPEQVAAIERERARALYDQAQMQAMQDMAAANEVKRSKRSALP